MDGDGYFSEEEDEPRTLADTFLADLDDLSDGGGEEDEEEDGVVRTRSLPVVTPAAAAAAPPPAALQNSQLVSSSLLCRAAGTQWTILTGPAAWTWLL